jgi:hypothetical protein
VRVRCSSSVSPTWTARSAGGARPTRSARARGPRARQSPANRLRAKAGHRRYRAGRGQVPANGNEPDEEGQALPKFQVTTRSGSAKRQGPKGRKTVKRGA